MGPSGAGSLVATPARAERALRCGPSPRARASAGAGRAGPSPRSWGPSAGRAWIGRGRTSSGGRGRPRSASMSRCPRARPRASRSPTSCRPCSAVLAGRASKERGATALYMAPDQGLARISCAASALGLAGLRAATHDGDSTYEERDWTREHGGYVLTNPDMLHRSLLPRHDRWSSFLRALRSSWSTSATTTAACSGHVAQVLRRLRRVRARYGGDPSSCSRPRRRATRPDRPRPHRSRPGGRRRGRIAEGQDTTSCCGSRPAPGGGENGAPTRRTAVAEAADLLADLVGDGTSTLAFVPVAPRRRGGRRHARGSRGGRPGAGRPGGAYRGGLPARGAARARGRPARGPAARPGRDERPRARRSTSAGLDAVLHRRLARAPARRCGSRRAAPAARGRDALAVLVARDDPLDTYLVHHPEALFDQAVEATVLDPDNPYVLAPHLCARGGELPLTERAAALRPAAARAARRARRRAGPARRPQRLVLDAPRTRRPTGRPARRRRRPVRVVEQATGPAPRHGGRTASATDRPPGAVYVHQGETLPGELARPRRARRPGRAADERNAPRRGSVTDIACSPTASTSPGAPRRLHFGSVEVTYQVVVLPARRRPAGECSARSRSTCRPRTLGRRAVWWTLPAATLGGGGRPADLPGAAPRRRARRHRHAAAVRDLRPLGHRRRVDRAAPRHRAADGLRVRRPPGRRRVRRARLRAAAAAGCATREPIARCELRRRVPVVRAVAQVRQRQRAARQGGGCGPCWTPARGRRPEAPRGGPGPDLPRRPRAAAGTGPRAVHDVDRDGSLVTGGAPLQGGAVGGGHDRGAGAVGERAGTRCCERGEVGGHVGPAAGKRGRESTPRTQPGPRRRRRPPPPGGFPRHGRHGRRPRWPESREGPEAGLSVGRRVPSTVTASPSGSGTAATTPDGDLLAGRRRSARAGRSGRAAAALPRTPSASPGPPPRGRPGGLGALRSHRGEVTNGKDHGRHDAGREGEGGLGGDAARLRAGGRDAEQSAWWRVIRREPRW